MDTLSSTFTENIVDDQQDQNLSQDDNVVPKKRWSKEKIIVLLKLRPEIYLQKFRIEYSHNLNFIKNSFIIDTLSFLVQNFNPINLERKLDVDEERGMIKLLWGNCIPHGFVRYMYKQQNYAVISKPNLTYQKANNIVKNFILEDMNRINTLKYKVEEKFPLIYYIYLLLFSKIYNRTNNFGIQKKTILIFIFKRGKIEKLLERSVQNF